MKCEPLVDDDGKVLGWVCGSRRKRAVKCVVCRKRPGTQLCDHALQPGEYRAKGQETCDAPLCKKCSHSNSPEIDYCPLHKGDLTQLSLFG